MLEVTFYTKDHCLLCDEAYDLLTAIQLLHPFHIQSVNIYEDDTLLEQYQLMIPVIQVGTTILTSNDIDFVTIEEAIKKNI